MFVHITDIPHQNSLHSISLFTICCMASYILLLPRCENADRDVLLPAMVDHILCATAAPVPDGQHKVRVVHNRVVALQRRLPAEQRIVRQHLEDLDMVLLMSVNPGFGGQKFIPQTMRKLRTLDQLRKERELSFEIEIDGGIGAANIAEISASGCDIFVAGSAVFGKPDRQEAVTELLKLMQV